MMAMISMVSRVSVMSEGMPDEMVGLMTSMLLESRMSEEYTEAAVALCGGTGHGQRSRFAVASPTRTKTQTRVWTKVGEMAGPWGRRTKAWRRSGDEPKIAF